MGMHPIRWLAELLMLVSAGGAMAQTFQAM